MSNPPATNEKSKNAVLYVSRIPYGFNEEAAWGFFAQFGNIKGVCYPRSKKTGRSKGYMFILFEDTDVARECANAMQDYYMFGKQIKTHVLSESHKIVYNRFKLQPKKFKFVPWRLIFKKSFNSNQTDEKKRSKIRKLLENDEKKKQLLKESGIDFDYQTYGDLVRSQ